MTSVLRCVACGRTLEEVGALIRCRLCRAVVMCAAHVAGTVYFDDAPDIRQPICRVCLERATGSRRRP